MGSVRNEKAVTHVGQAFLLIFVQLFEELRQVDDNTIANDGFRLGINDSTGQQVEVVLLITNNDSVSSIIASLDSQD